MPAYDTEPVAGDSVDSDGFVEDPILESEGEEATVVSPDNPRRRDTKMMSYEEAMALPVTVGDAMSEGGEAQLSAGEIARFMDGHLDEMYEECIRKELERGNSLGTVTLDLAIRGQDGMILGVTIEPGRRRFKSCLQSYLEDLRFPEFSSPRMGARYRIHAG